MKNNDVYSDDLDWEIGKRVKDFLPSPDRLVRKQDMKRVTMEVPSEIVLFFKEQAKKHGGSYQAMIRELLTEYAKN